METEWVLGIAAGAIAAASGMKMANSRAKNKEQELKEQTIMNEFVAPFLPGVMGFYHLEALGKDPLSAIDCEKLVDGIFQQSLAEEYHRFDRHEALGQLQEVAQAAKNNQRDLLKFLFWYLDFSNTILKDVLAQSHPLLRETRLLEKQLAVWCICHEELQEDALASVSELIHHSSYFIDALKEMEVGVFRELMADDELRNERRGNFARIIFQAFEKQAQGEVELKAVEQFQEHYNKRYTQRNKGQIRF